MLTDARLAVSNLAWTPDLDHAALRSLAASGVAAIEVAPSRIASWDALTTEKARGYRETLAEHGVRVSSLQAILFGVEGAHLLGSESEFTVLRSHLERVAAIGSALGAEVAVFGAPRNRLLHGRDQDESMALAAERLRVIAPYFEAAGMTFGIEPVPAYYGGEFATVADDVARLVEMVDHSAIRLHLDTGCVLLGNDSIAEKIKRHAGILSHFHVAEPDLAGFATPRCDHRAAAEALEQTRYRGWISIEMKPQAPDPIAAIELAVRFVQRQYFRTQSAPTGA